MRDFESNQSMKEAMQYLVGLGEDQVQQFFVEGKTFTNANLKQVNVELDPLAKSFKVNTLTSLIQYIKSNKDDLDLTSLIVVVNSEKHVELMSKMDEHKRRESYLYCIAEMPVINYNKYIDAEDFNIQSCFVEDEDTDRQAILKVIGNLKDEAVRNLDDDGTSQRVTIRTGVASVGEARVPNPVTLRPFCTFTEMIQPCRKFVFRLQEGGRCALYEADGGVWKNAAMQNIKLYLEEYLKEEIDQYGLCILA